MADVFLSYSSKNRDTARLVASALTGQGLSVWWDREILTGQAFDRAIEHELDAARSVVVLWSQESVSSEWVKNEAASAAERGVLLPANIDGTKLPLEFRRKQTADLAGFSGDPADAGFQALCRGIANVLGSAASLPPSPSPSPSPPPAPRPKQRLGLVALGAGAAAAVAIGFIASGDLGGPVAKSGSAEDVARPPDGQSGPTVSPGSVATPQSAAASTTAATPAATDSKGPAGVPPALADIVVGTYVGDVVSDSRASSRTHVTVTVSRLGPDAVRATSAYGRIGTVDIQLMRLDDKVVSDGGDTLLIVDLAAVPQTLSLTPRNELAYEGKRIGEAPR